MIYLNTAKSTNNCNNSSRMEEIYNKVYDKIYCKILKGIRQYFKKAKIKKAVIGLSGGIDSALSLRLTADAIGNKNITALLMPERGLISKANINDSIHLCRTLNVDYKIIEINPILKNFKRTRQTKNSWTNLKPRIRMLILYNFANIYNTLVIGTSNKTELSLGYFTKYGDGACDIEIIGDLYKTEVRALAKYLKLPENIINKTPSADLFKGQTDEKEIGAKYEDIDKMLKERKKKSKKIKELIEKNRHKSELPKIIRVK